MASSSRRLGALLVLLVLGACARQLDARTRQAWQDGGAPVTGTSPDGTDAPDATPTDPRAPPPALGWDRVAELVEHSVGVMQRSPDDEALAQLAQAWCTGEPQLRTTDDGEVWTCDLDPPVLADGVRFTLELGAPGVIGLVAAELSETDGARVAARARQAGERWCIAPWTDVSPPDDDPSAHQQHLETCPLEGGPLLTIGRIALDRAGRTWQVTVAVVATS